MTPNCNATGNILVTRDVGDYTYKTLHVREDVLSDGYFNGKRGQLEVGGIIDIRFTKDHKFARGHYMVIRADDSADVELWECGYVERDVAPPEAQPVIDETPPPKCLTEDCRVKSNGGRKAHQVIGVDTGTVYGHSKDKGIAELVASGKLGLDAEGFVCVV